MALTKCRACSNGSSGTPADFCLPLPTQIDQTERLRQVLSMDICINEAYSGTGNGAVTLHQQLSAFTNRSSTGIADASAPWKPWGVPECFSPILAWPGPGQSHFEFGNQDFEINPSFPGF